jgi:hypothetical protein
MSRCAATCSPTWGAKIAGCDAWPRSRRDELLGAPRTHPALYRLLRYTKRRKLRLDRAAVAYRQLYQVERGWRDLKGALKLRPVFHFREDRIRAHAGLCWLALLLIRVVENATGDSWRCVRDELERLHLVTLETSAGRVAKRSLTTTRQRQIFAALELPQPSAFSDFEVTATRA